MATALFDWRPAFWVEEIYIPPDSGQSINREAAAL